MLKDDNIQQEDLNRNDEALWGEAAEANRTFDHQGGNRGGNFRPHILVAFLVLLALFGFSRSSWAVPALTRGCCAPAAANSDSPAVNTAPPENLGGCCGGGGAPAVGVQYEEELRQAALQFYLETSGDSDESGLEALVQDFGCHQEILITKGGQFIMRVGYAYGEIYEIPGAR